MTRKRPIYVDLSDGDDIEEQDSEDGDFSPSKDNKTVSSPWKHFIL
jgi:hypothetical protein